MFLNMKVLAFFILPVLSSAQSGHRQDRVYLHVNKQVPYGIQPNDDFHIESDSLITRGYVDERGTQFQTYPINNRNSFNNQRIINNNPSEIQSRTDGNTRPVNRTQPYERSVNGDSEDRTDEDISVEEDRGTVGTNRRTNHGNDRVEPNIGINQRSPNTGINQGSFNTRTNQGSSNTRMSQGNSRDQEAASRRTINATPDQHNIIFIDTELEPFTNKPNPNTKTTEDNEISEEDMTRKTTTTIMPSVDDRAAFTGDKCPEGRVRFNGICVEIDGDR